MKAGELFFGDSSKIKVGDTIEFGSYPQENDTPSPIEWYVLEVKDGSALILCKDIIGSKLYDDEGKTWAGICEDRINLEYRIIWDDCINWEDCTLRYGDEAAYVDYYGSVDDYGANVSNRIIGVRPALWLKLNP